MNESLRELHRTALLDNYRNSLLKELRKTVRRGRRRLIRYNLKDLFKAAGALNLEFSEMTGFLIKSTFVLFSSGSANPMVLYEAFENETRKSLKEKDVINHLKTGKGKKHKVKIIYSDKLKKLQSEIISYAFYEWFSLELQSRQAEILSSVSSVRWLGEALLKSAGVSDSPVFTSGEQEKIKFVTPTFTEILKFKLEYLKGSNRIKTDYAGIFRKIKINKLNRKIFSIKEINKLYPEELDDQLLELRKKEMFLLKNDYQKRIERKLAEVEFNNYILLHKMTMGREIKSVKRFGSYMAAIEYRHS